MKRAGKIGRNEACPCGSGRKYKKCHLERESAKPLPYYKSAEDLLRLREGEKTCLFPASGDSQCTGQVIKAHSISRNSALTKIARGHQVYQLETNPHRIAKAKGRPDLKLEMIKSATTFTGFCGPHDAATFRPIDLGGLTPTPEQVLLLHYRSLCRELYVKRPSIKTNELLREADRGKSVEAQNIIQGLITARRLSIEDALRQLESDKAICDEALKKKDFSVLQGAFVHFLETPSLACAGYTQPTYDFAGRKLQDIVDMSTPFLNLSFTLIPNNQGGIAVFSWLPDADAVCRPFVESFMSLSDVRKSDALVQYVFDSFENFAAQPDWWESLTEDKKEELKQKSLSYTDMMPGGDAGALIPQPTTRFVDWQVVSTGWI